MKLTAEVLTLLLGILKLTGLLGLPWALVAAPVLIKYGMFLVVHAAMSRRGGRKLLPFIGREG